MKNKFEKLIEYVINDEDAKASDLFHEIVVGKSREIYEGLMQDDMGGDAVDDFIDDVSADEEGIDYSDDSDEDEDTIGMDLGDDETEEASDETEELEDRVVDLEDKLDELMAEFDDLIGDDTEAPAEEEVEMDMDMDIDSIEDADEEVDEEIVREYTEKAPKPVTSNNSDSTTSPVASKNDMGGKAVDPTGEEKGRPAPKAKDLGVDGPEGGAKLEKAPAPKTGE